MTDNGTLSPLIVQEAPVPNYGGFTLEVENGHSTARDQLSNEGTFLGWIRTGIAIMAIGLYVAQVNPTDVGVIFGVGFDFLSLVLFIYSLVRFSEVRDYLQRGDVVIDQKSTFFTLLIFALVSLLLASNFYL